MKLTDSYKKRLKKLSDIENVSEDSTIKEGFDKELVLKIYNNAKNTGGNILNAFKGEGKETSDMLKTFNHLLRDKLKMNNRETPPTKEEIDIALKQLKDIPKLAVLASFFGGISFVLPGSTQAYLVAAIGIYNSTNGKVNLIPSSFEKILKNEGGNKLSFKNLTKKNPLNQ